MTTPHPRTIVRDAARKGDLTRIHIAKAQIGLTDDQYRGILHDVCGVASAKDLDARGRGKLIAHFKKLGWRPSPPRKNVDGKPASGLARRPGNYESKIRALWLDLHARGIVREPDELAMQKFVRRTTGVDLAHWCSDAQCVRVIESLKKWGDRVDAERTRLAQALANVAAGA